MPLAYAFRPNLFAEERRIIIDDDGITIRDGESPERRVAWQSIEEVHIQTGSEGDENLVRWTATLGIKSGEPIRINSVNVRGTADFEDKSREFAELLAAIHQALIQRTPEVKFVYGRRSGLMLAWRIALVLCVLAGCFGVAATLYAAQWEAIAGAGAFVWAGIAGLWLLRGRGPRPYNPATFMLPGRSDKAA